MMVLDLGWLCEIHVCASDEEAPTCRVYKDHSLTGPASLDSGTFVVNISPAIFSSVVLYYSLHLWQLHGSPSFPHVIVPDCPRSSAGSK